jgi:predicted ATPase
VGEGAEVLHGRAYEAGAALPYQPIVEALRARLGKESNPQRWLSLTWWGELSRLLPEIADALPGLPRPLALGEGEARARLYEAVARLGAALAAEAPLVAFFDDAQWADEGTLALVRYLIQRFSQPSAHLAGLFVLAVRSDDLAANPALAEWLGALGHVAPLRRLRLGALALDDVRRLVQALGIEPAREAVEESAIEAFCQRLFAETGGHPFFVLQMLRALTESRVLWQDPAGAWHINLGPAGQGTLGLPQGVRDLVQARLARLGPNGLAACQAGAVLGEGFEFGALCQVAELDEAAGLAAVDELLGRSLWREAAGPPGRPERLSFTHDKLRETAYAGLNAARRRSLHRRALQVLEQGAAPPAELAHHALAAAARPAAFRYSLAAGDAASRVFAGRDALSHYAQAQALLAGGPPETEGPAEPLEASPAERQQLLLQTGAAYELVNDWGGANDQYELLLILARRHDWPAAEGLALNRLALVAAKSRFDIPAAAERLKAAQQAAARSSDLGVRAETQMNLAQMGLYRWDFQMMRSHGEQALALARELGQPELAARALNMLGYAGVVSGEWETIEALARESWELFVAAGNQAAAADSLGLLGASQTQSGRAGEGLTACRAAYAIGLELENEWVQANTAYHLANTLLEVGKLSEALEIGQRGVAAARVAGHPPLLVFNLAVCGSIYRAVLALESAKALHAEANAIAQALQQPYLVEWAASELCADCAFGANWPAAAEQAERALAVRAVDPTLKSYAGLTRWCQAAALARSGPEGQQRAAEDLHRLDQQTQGAPYQRYRPAYLRATAELHLLSMSEAEVERGLGSLEQAAKLAVAMQLPVEVWQIERRLSEAYRAAGKTALAQQALEQAAQIGRRLAESLADETLRESFQAAARD